MPPTLASGTVGELSNWPCKHKFSMQISTVDCYAIKKKNSLWLIWCFPETPDDSTCYSWYNSDIWFSDRVDWLHEHLPSLAESVTGKNIKNCWQILFFCGFSLLSSQKIQKDQSCRACNDLFVWCWCFLWVIPAFLFVWLTDWPTDQPTGQPDDGQYFIPD